MIVFLDVVFFGIERTVSLGEVAGFEKRYDRIRPKINELRKCVFVLVDFDLNM